MNSVTLSVNSAANGAGSTTLGQHLAGKILAIGLDCHASLDSGADITVSVSGPEGPALTVLTRSNSATDAWLDVRRQAVDSAGSAITGEYTCVPFSGLLSASVAQAGGALTGAVKVTIFFEG